MDQLGYNSKSGGTTGNKQLVAEQARRIVRANLEVTWHTDGLDRDRGAGMRFADVCDHWWDRSKNPTHPVDGQRRASPVPPSSACRAGHLTYRYGGLRYTGETHGSRSVNRFSLESSRNPRAGSS